MHEYDVALKSILTVSGSVTLPAVSGCTALRWLNVELPKVNNLRVDLLAESPDGELIHFELQSRNEKGFPLRMAGYAFAIARQYGRFPRQIALYVGKNPLQMKNSIATEDMTFRFRLIDIREVDGEALLASPNLGDNVLALLTRLGENSSTVRRILQKISCGPAAQRSEALARLSIIGGLRGLTSRIKEEAKRMPITESIMDNGIIGPAIRKGMRLGATEGRIRGQREILLSQIEKRFGSVPAQARKRLEAMPSRQLKAVALRLLDAKTIDKLFPR